MRAFHRSCFEYSFQFDQCIVARFSGNETPESVNRRGVLRDASLALFGICASAQVPHKRLIVREKVEPGIRPGRLAAERRHSEKCKEKSAKDLDWTSVQETDPLIL
jgi:hypothetical protein